MSGLVVNIYGGELENYTIKEIEKNGIGNSRFIKLNDGVPIENFVWFEKDDGRGRIDIIFPIISKGKYSDFQEGKQTVVKTLVRLNELRKYCLKDTSCIPDKVDIEGLVESGLGKISYDEMKTIEFANLKLDKDFILIEHGAKPRELYINIILFLIGSVFGGTILKSFFRKSKNFDDWIDNITEKKELK